MGDGFEAVLEELDAVVETCVRRRSRAGYFAALYRAVTRAVQARAAAGEFEDADRMRAFVGAFARRYLDAFDAWSGGQPTTEAWRAAFAAAQRWRPTVLQHVMLGINAHINLDLGIVTAEAADASGGLAPIARDFDEVNVLLASLVVACQDAVGAVSPWVGLLDRVGGMPTPLSCGSASSRLGPRHGAPRSDWPRWAHPSGRWRSPRSTTAWRTSLVW